MLKLASTAAHTPLQDEQSLTITPGHTSEQIPGTSNILFDPNAAISTVPHFIVQIGDGLDSGGNTKWSTWPEVVHVIIEHMGYEEAAGITLYGVYTMAADADDIGSAKDGSRYWNLVEGLEFDDPAAVSSPDNVDRTRRFIKRIPVQVFAGFTEKTDPSEQDLNGGVPVFEGVVDRITVDYSKNTYTIYGRDYASLFLESSTYTQFRNQTTSGVVKEIAESLGFDTTNVRDTETPVGTAFDYEHIDTTTIPTQGLNNWEIIIKMANFDYFKVFTRGKKLYYVPFEAFDDVIEFAVGNNIDNLQTIKNFAPSASRIAVEVASELLKGKDSIVAKSGVAESAGSRGDVAQFRLVMPNLPQDEAGIYAEAMALIAATTEYVAIIMTTGAPQQEVTNRLLLGGTGTDFDRRDYMISRIRWDIGWESGWRSEIYALSLPPAAWIRLHRIRRRRGFTIKPTKAG